ncbi:MAG TPA: flagellar hook protein FlgE [Polyangiaceae bacterium]
MVLRAMYSGVSGLRAEGEALGVVGDNIANVNTVGFKGQRAIFQDVLGHSILAGTGSSLPGSGVRVGDIQQLFTQGTLSNTGVGTDVALNGDGFFTVKGAVDGVSGNFFTRAGTFVLDKDGFLVNPNGLEVQGYAALGDGTFAASISSVQAPTAALPPRATQAAEITANLDSQDKIITAAWDPQDPTNTANFSTTMTTYDDLGNGHTLDVYFRKTADNTWDWYGVVPGSDTNDPAAANTNVVAGTGTLTFNNDPAAGSVGALSNVTANTVSVNFAGIAAPQSMTLDFGTSITAGGTGLDGLTQFGSPSNVSSQSQDGYASGDFSGISIDGTGVVMGLYTNGQKLALSQLAIAKFRSNDGLGRAGQSLWIDTRDSGSAAYGVAGSGGRGAASSGALEGSNVDLAEEFVGLIQHQRSFSANSKTITTADEMLQELINIKR